MGDKAKARQRRDRARARRRHKVDLLAADGWTHERAVAVLQIIADGIGAYAGLPMPVTEFPLTLEPRYPHTEALEQVIPGSTRPRPSADQHLTVINQWWSPARQALVSLYRDHLDSDRIKANLDYAHNRAGDRVTFWLNTAGASQGWDYRLELKAMEKLRELTTDVEFAMYVTTGTFLHTSPGSRVTYLLRRARPTVAIVPTDRADDTKPMRILAVLCLHPVGYYQQSWAGAMVPTDDVISHLLWIRSDEHGFWRRANQHNPAAPEAGL